MGLTGEEAERAVQHLSTQLNKKGWFVVGQRVTIPGDHNAKIDEMRSEPDGYSEDDVVLNQRWAASNPVKPVEQKPKEVPIPQNATNYAAKAKGEGGKAEIRRNDDGTFSVIISGDKYAKAHNRTQYEMIYDAKGSNIKQLHTCSNGNVVTYTKVNGQWKTSTEDPDKTPAAQRASKLHKPRRPNQMSHYQKPQQKAQQQQQTPATSQFSWADSTVTNPGFPFSPITSDSTQVASAQQSGATDRASSVATNPLSQTSAGYSGNVPMGLPKGVVVENGKAKAVLLPEEEKYPEEMQAFILEQRQKGIEYTITKSGRTYNLMQDMFNSTYTPVDTIDVNQPFFTKNIMGMVNQQTAYADTFKTFTVSTPINVTEKITALQETNDGSNIEMTKRRSDGVYVITQTEGNLASKNLKSIQYFYNSDGNFMYQLEASSQDESVRIGRSVKNNQGKYVMKYTQFKDAKGYLANENIPQQLWQKYNEYKIEDETASIVRGKSTYTITRNKGQYLTQNGLSKIVSKYDAFGKLISEDYTYTNGRTLNYYDASSRGNDAAHTVNPMSIRLPKQYQGTDTDSSQIIYGLETKGPKDTAQRFSGAIADNKAHLMQTLHLTNEEYDNLAIIAMGIAEQETHFGQEDYEDTQGGMHTQTGVTARATRKRYANQYLWSTSKQMQHSQGITQIRFQEAISDENVKKLFIANGVLLERNQGESEQAWHERSFKEFLKSPEKQAVATMILLKQRKNIAESSTWQTRLRTNNAKVTNPEDRLTTNDIIALSWNGLGPIKKRMDSGEVITINTEKAEVPTGRQTAVYSPTTGTYAYSVQETQTLNGTFYAKAVRKYSSHFFADPKTEGNGSLHMTSTQNQAGAQGATGQDNGGALGEVVFKPKSYANSGRVSTGGLQTKDQVKELINKNTRLSDANRALLISYVENDSIGFGNQGLTEAEAKAITDTDVQNMTQMLNQIAAGTLTPNQANMKFESAQLESRQFTVATSSVSRRNLLTTGRSSNPRTANKVSGNLNFDINQAFYANGTIPRHTAQYVNLSDNYYQNAFAVTRSKGVNPYLANGTMARDVDRVAAEHAEYTATELFESSGHCKNGVSVDLEYSLGIDHMKIRGNGGRTIQSAKELTEFYNAHPEVFDHIKWVDMGNGQARELNVTDVHNLPCGYYGVFTPGEGTSLSGNTAYDTQHGHAFVSDGFGECNADEHDNGNWAHFSNGKGEHGKLDVYRLSDNVVAVYSEELGRTINVPLDINPWYLKEPWKSIQAQERQKRGLPPLEAKAEFKT